MKAGAVNFAKVLGGGQGMVEFADRDGLQFALDNKHDLMLNGQQLEIRHFPSDSHWWSRCRRNLHGLFALMSHD